jgi:hypothetical protein
VVAGNLLLTALDQFLSPTSTLGIAVDPAATTVAIANASAIYAQSGVINLTATVTSPNVTVNEGTVTFTITGTNFTLTARSNTVASGSATAVLSAGGLSAGTDSISATYNPAVSNPNFVTSISSVLATLTIAQAQTTTTLIDNGPNPSTSQPANFTATDTGGVPDGETVTLEDASNANAVVASGSLSSGSASLTVAAGALSVGTHNLFAVYGGDSNFAGSQSSTIAQTINPAVAAPTLVGSPVINGDDPNGLYTAAGQTANGKQRSMVEDVVYTFNQAVTIPSANAAFTVAVAAGQTGTVPTTLTVTAVPGSNGTKWAVTLTGKAAGVLASIADGVYTITLNPAGVFAAADGATAMAAGSGQTDTFYRLFGDINGDHVVNAADNLKFRTALSVYNAIFDYNGDGAVNAADNLKFRTALSTTLGDFTTTI